MSPEPSLYYRIERFAFVRCIAFDCLYQIGNEVVPLLELNVDIAKCLINPLT